MAHIQMVVYLIVHPKSLKYLLGNSPKSYTENKFTGKTAQHSQLHENKNIANDIIQFLWSK